MELHGYTSCLYFLHDRLHPASLHYMTDYILPLFITGLITSCLDRLHVRLAAAGRLRSAVALELVAGKVWALPIAVQPARGIRRCNGTGHPEWVRCHGPRAGAESHHACGREELPRCWADSETRPQG